MKKIILATIISLFIHLPLFAARGQFTLGLLKVEPTVTAERDQRFYPTAHSKDKLLYGVRILFGPPLLSIEGEYLMGNDVESFPDENLKIKSDSERFKLGLRSGFTVANYLSWFLRGGLQGSKRKTERINTLDQTSTSQESAFYVDPYLGTGFRFHLLSNVSASGDITAIFTDRNKKGDKDYQASLAISLAI